MAVLLERVGGVHQLTEDTSLDGCPVPVIAALFQAAPSKVTSLSMC